MPASRHQGLIDGSFVDPFEWRVCRIGLAIGAIDAIGAALAPAIGGEVAAGGLGAALGGEAAGLTAADFSLGLGESLAGPLTLGDTALLPLTTPAAELTTGAAGTLADALGGASGFSGLIEPLSGTAVEAGSTLAPGGALTTGTAAAPTAAAPAAGAGTGAAGAAAAPALPTSVGAAPATVTGDLAGAAQSAGAANFDATFPSDVQSAITGNFDNVGKVAGTGSKGGFLDRTLSSLTGGSVGGGDLRDLGTVLSGGMMLKNVLGGDKALPGEAGLNRGAAGLEATARGQAALGTQLESYLQSGKLPPGVEAGLRSATNAAHATIKAQHAARGTSGSSAEASEIQAANDRALAAGQQVALQLLQQGSTMVGQGVNTEGLASNLYQQILGNALEKDKEFGQAVGSFASALARSGDSGSNTITLKAA